MSDTIVTTNQSARRRLRGTTFLSLEHALKAVLMVVVVTLLGVSIVLALQLWTGAASGTSFVRVNGSAAELIAGTAMTLAAALIVLVPALIVLELRTRAEYQKRPDFRLRLAYRIPLYAAFAAVLTLTGLSLIQLLAAFLTSLTLLGAAGANIGAIYLGQFLPALLTLALYGAAAVYLFQILRGKDRGAIFGLAVVTLSVVMVLALFITSVVLTHQSTAGTAPGSNGSVDDFFREYNSQNNPY